VAADKGDIWRVLVRARVFDQDVATALDEGFATDHQRPALLRRVGLCGQTVRASVRSRARLACHTQACALARPGTAGRWIPRTRRTWSDARSSCGTLVGGLFCRLLRAQIRQRRRRSRYARRTHALSPWRHSLTHTRPPGVITTRQQPAEYPMGTQKGMRRHAHSTPVLADELAQQVDVSRPVKSQLGHPGRGAECGRCEWRRGEGAGDDHGQE